MDAPLKRMLIYLDHLLRRDWYLTRLKQRIDHFQELEPEPSSRVVDSANDGSHKPGYDVPRLDAHEFTLESLKKAIRESGCCQVHNFYTDAEVNELRACVAHSFAVSRGEIPLHKYLSKQVDLSDFLAALKPNIEKNRKINNTYSDTVKLGKNLTRTLGADTSCLTATSPVLVERLLSLFERKRLDRLLQQYFENNPCVSVYKWVLRNTVSPKQPIDFHQDGAFMGSDIDSLNCWIPLSDCGAGTNVPGMDIVPVRLNQAFEKGSGVLDWTISQQAVVDQIGEEAIVTPAFRRGDAFFFDHGLIHRTQHVPEPANKRYAIETWFFDSENFPKNQIPIRW